MYPIHWQLNIMRKMDQRFKINMLYENISAMLFNEDFEKREKMIMCISVVSAVFSFISVL